jgi:hypothetical protein
MTSILRWINLIHAFRFHDEDYMRQEQSRLIHFLCFQFIRDFIWAFIDKLWLLWKPSKTLRSLRSKTHVMKETTIWTGQIERSRLYFVKVWHLFSEKLKTTPWWWWFIMRKIDPSVMHLYISSSKRHTYTDSSSILDDLDKVQIS